MDLVTPVFDQLQALGLPYQLIEHAPALTTEQADDFIAELPGVRTKTLFLTNKKKTQFYLLIMDDRKQLIKPSEKKNFLPNCHKRLSKNILATSSILE